MFGKNRKLCVIFESRHSLPSLLFVLIPLFSLPQPFVFLILAISFELLRHQSGDVALFFLHQQVLVLSYEHIRYLNFMKNLLICTYKKRLNLLFLFLSILPCFLLLCFLFFLVKFFHSLYSGLMTPFKQGRCVNIRMSIFLIVRYL